MLSAESKWLEAENALELHLVRCPPVAQTKPAGRFMPTCPIAFWDNGASALDSERLVLQDFSETEKTC